MHSHLSLHYIRKSIARLFAIFMSHFHLDGVISVLSVLDDPVHVIFFTILVIPCFVDSH